MQETINTFISNYMPGFYWLVFILGAHIFLSTIAHIIKKDFKFIEWPKCLKMWILFMIAIVTMNGVASVSNDLSGASYITPITSGLQALVYAMYFGYYLDNIFSSLNLMGLPVEPGLSEAIKGLFEKVKSLVTKS
jgi:hypothetical protein